jgi:hypothetical protein
MGITVSIGWLLFVSSSKHHNKNHGTFPRRKTSRKTSKKLKRKEKRKLEKDLSDGTEDPRMQRTRRGKGGKIL